MFISKKAFIFKYISGEKYRVTPFLEVRTRTYIDLNIHMRNSEFGGWWVEL